MYLSREVARQQIVEQEATDEQETGCRGRGVGESGVAYCGRGERPLSGMGDLGRSGDPGGVVEFRGDGGAGGAC
jgi:hypothetical protein